MEYQNNYEKRIEEVLQGFRPTLFIHDKETAVKYYVKNGIEPNQTPIIIAKNIPEEIEYYSLPINQ